MATKSTNAHSGTNHTHRGQYSARDWALFATKIETSTVYVLDQTIQTMEAHLIRLRQQRNKIVRKAANRGGYVARDRVGRAIVEF